MEAIVGFAFILLVPLVIVGATVAGLFAVGALFDALENPKDLKTRIDSVFRKPPAAAQPAPADHYYKPYWAGRG
jgi:hypothetical protein